MDWPHSPKHWLFEPGIYMVIAGTYKKIPYLDTPERLDFFQKTLFSISADSGCLLRAWAILSNHYHLIVRSPSEPETMGSFMCKLHMVTAIQFNIWDACPGRKVWFQYWDSHITFEQSYLARLNYVHRNREKHGVVSDSEDYRWCSAAWFARNTPVSFVKTVKNFKIDRLKIPDDF